MSDDGLLLRGPDLWDRVLGAGEPDAPMTRAAGVSNCRRCEAYLIHGLDDDTCALDAYADAEPVSRFGEACARLLGLRTYELHRGRATWRLEIRDAGSMRLRPAGARIVDVLAEHRCGADLERADPRLPPRVAITDPTPPF